MSGTLQRNGQTVEARRYAARELARRAGVGRQQFEGWRIETQPRQTLIYVQPGSNRHVSVPSCDTGIASGTQSNQTWVSRAGWMQTPADSVAALVPEFILPFASEVPTEFGPLFRPLDDESVACSCDVLTATLLTLARYEEMQSTTRDAHGRFPASASLATREGFLQRPIVDEYGLAFQQALSHLLPGWQPAERVLRVKLSHDADLVGLPFSLRASVGHTVRRHRPRATLQDLFSLFLPMAPAYLQLVDDVVKQAQQRGIQSAVYWQAAPATAFDTGYDPRNVKVRKVISHLTAEGVEMGVHPSYSSFNDTAQLQREVQILRDVFGMGTLGGRQHYLRWSPDTWLHWEQCGLAYDSTVGYADHIGFRAGTCIPYRPWLLGLNREARLLEIPLIVMDETLVDYMGLKEAQVFEAVNAALARCRLVGGVFTLLWHNSSLLEPAYGPAYASLLNSLAGNANYDWKTDSASD